MSVFCGGVQVRTMASWVTSAFQIRDRIGRGLNCRGYKYWNRPKLFSTKRACARGRRRRCSDSARSLRRERIDVADVAAVGIVIRPLPGNRDDQLRRSKGGQSGATGFATAAAGSKSRKISTAGSCFSGLCSTLSFGSVKVSTTSSPCWAAARSVTATGIGGLRSAGSPGAAQPTKNRSDK